jgi:hypothetical protein
VVSFPHVSTPDTCIHISPPPYVPQTRTIPFFVIWPPELYLVRIRYYKAFATSSPLCLFLAQIFFWISYSHRLSACVPPSVWETKFHTHKNNRQNYSSKQVNLYILVSKYSSYCVTITKVYFTAISRRVPKLLARCGRQHRHNCRQHYCRQRVAFWACYQHQVQWRADHSSPSQHGWSMPDNRYYYTHKWKEIFYIHSQILRQNVNESNVV